MYIVLVHKFNQSDIHNNPYLVNQSPPTLAKSVLLFSNSSSNIALIVMKSSLFISYFFCNFCTSAKNVTLVKTYIRWKTYKKGLLCLHNFHKELQPFIIDKKNTSIFPFMSLLTGEKAFPKAAVSNWKMRIFIFLFNWELEANKLNLYEKVMIHEPVNGKYYKLPYNYIS